MSYYYSLPNTITLYNSQFESGNNVISLSKIIYTSEFEYAVETATFFCFGKKQNKISDPKIAVGCLTNKFETMYNFIL